MDNVAANAQTDQEHGRIADTTVAIRNAVNAGAQDGVYIVHIASAAFQLAASEAEAFKANYAAEESFRGRLATSFIDLASVYGRMLAAYDEYKQVRSSAFLWQPKAEALHVLIPYATHALEQSEAVFSTAKQRGLTDKVSALCSSRERLQTLVTEVQASLVHK